MSFSKYLRVTGYKNYFTFEGRASRGEMWNWFLFLLGSSFMALILQVLFLFILLFMAGAKDGVLVIDSETNGFLALITFLFILTSAVTMMSVAIYNAVGTISLTVRRLHDCNLSAKTALLIFIPVIGALTLFVICYFVKGTTGENNYGPEPTY